MHSTEFASPFSATSTEGLAEFLRENSEHDCVPVTPLGGGTGQMGWELPHGTVPISTVGLAKIVDYPARDMTVTVEAGVTIGTLAKLLEQEGQQLPIDAPHVDVATVGGNLACNVAGSRRYGYGTLRDYLIGVTAVDASGRIFHAGGRVVKNVAGYDLCKMMVGSQGTLAVITQATLKLKPRPESMGFLRANFSSFDDADAALATLATSDARPVSIDVANGGASQRFDTQGIENGRTPVTMMIRVEGSRHDIEWQLRVLRENLAGANCLDDSSVQNEDAETLARALCDFPVDEGESPASFQVNVRASQAMELLNQATRAGIAAIAHAGNGVVVGHLPPGVESVERATEILRSLRETASVGDGSLVVTQCFNRWRTDLPHFEFDAPARKSMWALKQQLDPRNLLSPGRMLTGE